MKKNKILPLIAVSGLLFSSPTFADFSIQSNGQDTKPLLEEYNEYGNAQTTTFRKAVEGSDMSIEEQKEVADLLPPVYDDKVYARFSAHVARNRISNLENKSLGTNSGATLTLDSQNQSERGMEVAIGKVFGNWRAEAEWLLSKNFEYNPNPAFVGGGQALTASIKTNAFFINGYYEILDHERLKPFVFVGAGIAHNKVSTSFSGLSKTKEKYFPAFGFGLGTRLKLVDNFYMDLAWRYATLGDFTIYDGGVTKIKGTRSINAFSLGLSILMN